jgi:hypothetical protein
MTTLPGSTSFYSGIFPAGIFSVQGKFVWPSLLSLVSTRLPSLLFPYRPSMVLPTSPEVSLPSDFLCEIAADLQTGFMVEDRAYGGPQTAPFVEEIKIRVGFDLAWIEPTGRTA